MEYLSSSRTNLYLQCSLKYKFQYVDGFPKPFKSSGLAFGSAFHSALAWFHQQRIERKEISLEKFYRIFDADWYSQQIEAEIRYKEGESELKLAIIAKEMLNLYFQNPHNEVKGAEIPFTIPLTNPSTGKGIGINLEGFFDLIEKENDGDIIVEFKTTGQAMDQEDADEHIQLTAYSYAYEMLNHKPPKLLKIVNFVKTKKPKLLVFDTNRTEADYRRFFTLASQVIRGIESQVFFPRTSFICNDCEYAEHCREWGGQRMSA